MAMSMILLLAAGTIPGPDGTYTGCFRNTPGPAKGALRVVDAAVPCKLNETRIKWHEKGPEGPRGLPGLNALRAAQKRWYQVNEAGAAFTVGNDPMALAFDGSSMWVANHGDGTVTKLRASDGQVLGTYSIAGGALALAFDGASMWVGNGSSLTKLRASDGRVLGSYTIGWEITGLAFDGTFLWASGLVRTPGEDNLFKIRPSDGAVLASYRLRSANCPRLLDTFDLLFDGESLWVLGGCSPDQSAVLRVRPSDGAVLAQKGDNAFVGMVFDGANVWVASWAFPDEAWKLRSSDASVLCTYTSGYSMAFIESLAFDGLHIWVGGTPPPEGGDNVTLLDPRDCSVVGTYQALLTDVNAFDGVNVWSACRWEASSNTVCKL